MSIFRENFNFLGKIFDFWRKFRFWRTFRFLGKISILGENFDFSKNDLKVKGTALTETPRVGSVPIMVGRIYNDAF